MPFISLIKQCGRGRDKGNFRGETAVAGSVIELRMLILGRKTKGAKP